ncbi:MAG: hypothetical protein CTY19_02015 [Methylomonas sp.]|nr:MAG: hypothetical protein CTY19_02015 [Methylomonas sp.]
MRTDLVAFIAQKTPLPFFMGLIENLEEAYFLAYKDSLDYAEPEQKRILPQMRHYRQNTALRKTALSVGLSSSAPHTNPKGERYSVAFAEDITFGRTSVPFHNRIPRPSKHRAAIASVNTRLEPINLDLFTPVTKPTGDALGCLVITVNPPHHEGQSVPRNICIGVPYSNLKGWHLFEPVTEVLAAYNPANEIQVPDLAFAKLKIKLRDAEQ